MFYLTTCSKHFYLRLYGVGYVVKDHKDGQKGKPLPSLTCYSFPLAARYLLYAPCHRHDSTCHGLCYVVDQWLKRGNNSAN